MSRRDRRIAQEKRQDPLDLYDRGGRESWHFGQYLLRMIEIPSDFSAKLLTLSNIKKPAKAGNRI